MSLNYAVSVLISLLDIIVALRLHVYKCYLLPGSKSINTVDGQNPALPIIRNIP